MGLIRRKMLPSLLGSARARVVWLAAYCPLPVSMILPHGCKVPDQTFQQYGIGTSLGSNHIDRNGATIHFEGFEDAKIAASLDVLGCLRVSSRRLAWP